MIHRHVDFYALELPKTCLKRAALGEPVWLAAAKSTFSDGRVYSVHVFLKPLKPGNTRPSRFAKTLARLWRLSPLSREEELQWYADTANIVAISNGVEVQWIKSPLERKSK